MHHLMVKVLEAGCGIGQYVFYFQKLGFDSRGIDISTEGIRLCKNYAEANSFDSNIFEKGDIRKTNFKTNSISYYISLGVIEHFVEAT